MPPASEAAIPGSPRFTPRPVLKAARGFDFPAALRRRRHAPSERRAERAAGPRERAVAPALSFPHASRHRQAGRGVSTAHFWLSLSRTTAAGRGS